MSNNSISNANSSAKTIRTFEEIQALTNVSEKTKTFLNSVFKELDITNEKGNVAADRILQQKEGSIYVFEDGSVSVTKNGKFYAGTSAQGAEARANGDYLNVKYADGSESLMQDGKLVSGKTSTGRSFIVKEGVITFNETKDAKRAKQAKQTPAPASTKKVDAAKESDSAAKTTTNPAKPAKMINGVPVEQVDNLAKEYLEIVRSRAYSQGDILEVIKNKKKFCDRNSNTFTKLAKCKPEAYKSYKPVIIETDNYRLEFSAYLEPYKMKYYWDLYYVEPKNEK